MLLPGLGRNESKWLSTCDFLMETKSTDDNNDDDNFRRNGAGADVRVSGTHIHLPLSHAFSFQRIAQTAQAEEITYLISSSFIRFPCEPLDTVI